VFGIRQRAQLTLPTVPSLHRQVLHEPMLILGTKALPLLFASELCANVCGETIVNLLNTFSVIVLECIKQIKSG